MIKRLLPNRNNDFAYSKAIAEASLYEFYRQAFEVIEGEDCFVDEWFLEVIAEHLQLVFFRKIRNLLINVPPRLGKTSLISIAFPAWCWIHNANEKFLCASCTNSLSLEIADKSRLLIMSEWFQKRWGDKVKLRDDKNSKSFFINTKLGYRVSTSVHSSVIGRGGSILICDDPNNAGQESEVVREAANKWWAMRWSNRINDRATGCKILVQQRSDENDVSGTIIKNDTNNDWVKLILPLEFESSNVIETVKLPGFMRFNFPETFKDRPWRDHRQKNGELLSNRITEQDVESLKKSMGSYGYAALYQQRPAPIEGGLIKKHWFSVCNHQDFQKIWYVVQSWDTAFSSKDTAAYSACTTWGVIKDGTEYAKLVLLSAWRDRLEYPELKKMVVKLALNCLDVEHCAIDRRYLHTANITPNLVIMESEASAKCLIPDLNSMSDLVYSGVAIQPFSPSKFGDKVQRVKLASPLMEAGLIKMPPKFDNNVIADFAAEFVNEISYFPNPRSLDYTDTLTQVIIALRNVGYLVHPEQYVPIILDEQNIIRY